MCRGGKTNEPDKRPLRKLPFDCCSISFQPFSNPVCSPDGMIFDLVYARSPLLLLCNVAEFAWFCSNIMPYFKKHGNKNPVNGALLHGRLSLGIGR